MTRLPALYAILDAETLARRGLNLLQTAEALRAGGVQLLQYRDKAASTSEYLAHVLAVAGVFAGSSTALILNDHAALVTQAGGAGVHLGQSDGPSAAARAVVGPHSLIGRSTHTLEQALAAERDPDIDYLAFGPIYATQSKVDPEPVVGVAGLREIALSVSKPVVGIGGVTAERLPEVFAAGARSAAMIGALLATEGVLSEHVRRLVGAAEQLAARAR